MPVDSSSKNGVSKENLHNRSFKSPKNPDFDPDDPDYIKELQRPAVIKEDLWQMERGQRVQSILKSRTFCEELEKLIIGENRTNADLANLGSLQQLSELILPKNQYSHGSGSAAIVPIADLRGSEGSKYANQEKFLRNKFASLFRLIDLFRWSQGISNHCSLRISDQNILVNPFCLMYHEITASSLIKVDFQGNPVLEDSHSILGVNNTFHFHSAIYKNRPDVKCIIHLLTPVVGAVAAMKCGLLPISQEAMIAGEISYHDFQATFTESAVARDLGPMNKILLIRNSGFLICAGTIEEAFHLAYNLILACETQVRAVKAGFENLVIPSEEAQRKAHETANRDGGGGVNKVANENDSKIKWKVGELEWEAWMRVLDNAGFRSGHVFKQSMSTLKKPAHQMQSDVEVPPAACSYGLLDETDHAHHTARKGLKRDDEKLRWLNYNPYQKVEYCDASKKVTKWVQKDSPDHLSQLKITTTSHQQISPPVSASVSPNPKELKDKQKKIKELSRMDNISAGPQSKILDGIAYHEAAALKKEAELAEKILIGAASKAIIDRDHRENTQIYSQFYQSNPFSTETEQKIKRYMTEIEQKNQILTYQSDSGTFDRFEEIGSGGSQSPESVSLMQAAREHNLSQSAATPPPTQSSVFVRETTFDARPDNYKASPVKQYKAQQSPGGIPEEKNFSEDETDVNKTADSSFSPEKMEKKKKKLRLLSFHKSKKDKEKH